MNHHHGSDSDSPKAMAWVLSFSTEEEDDQMQQQAEDTVSQERESTVKVPIMSTSSIRK